MRPEDELGAIGSVWRFVLSDIALSWYKGLVLSHLDYAVYTVYAHLNGKHIQALSDSKYCLVPNRSTVFEGAMLRILLFRSQT